MRSMKQQIRSRRKKHNHHKYKTPLKQQAGFCRVIRLLEAKIIDTTCIEFKWRAKQNHAAFIAGVVAKTTGAEAFADFAFPAARRFFIGGFFLKIDTLPANRTFLFHNNAIFISPILSLLQS